MSQEPNHELVDLLREELPSSAQKEAMDRRLAALGISVGAASAALVATGTASAMGAGSATGTGTLGTGLLAKITALGVGKMVVGAVAVGAVTASLAWPEARVTKPEVRMPAKVVVSPVVAPAPREEPTVVEPAKRRPVKRPAKRGKEKVEVRASTLDAESSLLADAIEALHGGQTERARTLLAEHAERYPNGLLRAERKRALEQLRALTAPP